MNLEALSTVGGLLGTAVVFTLMITVLVVVHEFGHYWVAKLCGMKVDAFAIMMGGIRKTPLTNFLKRPLVSNPVVMAAYALAGIVTAAGLLTKNTPLSMVGLIALAYVVPIWVATRLGALYHLPLLKALRPLAIGYAGFFVVLMLSTQMKGGAVVPSLSLQFYGSLIGLMILYYSPLASNGGNEDKMGFGQVEVDGEEVPVRYRPLWHTTNREGTEFSMLLLPLGGFAKIHGMQPQPDSSETKIEGGFYQKAPILRFLTLFAGPIFSIALGMVLLFVATVGYGDMRLSNKPIIDQLSKDKPAALAGMQVGDHFVQLDNVKIETFYDVVKYIRERPGQPIDVTFERNGVLKKVQVTPITSPVETVVFGPGMLYTDETRKQGYVGISPGTEMVRLSAAEAAVEALDAPVKAAKFFAKMFSSIQKAKDNIGGIGSVAEATHAATQTGMYPILTLAAALSISLGFMNLLPIPPLDGGQMVVAVIEMFRRGRRLSLEVQSMVSNFGLVLVLLLMIFAISQDVGRGFAR